MISTLKQFFLFITVRERYQILWLIVILLLMSTLEILGIFSILPFMTLVANPNTIQDNKLLSSLYRTFDFHDNTTFLYFLGCASIGLIIFSNTFGFFSMRYMNRFVFALDSSISERLLMRYVQKPYIFFLNCNTSDLIRNILSEVSAATNGVILPGMQMIAKICVCFLICILLIVANPLLAMVTCFSLGGAYICIYLIIRQRIEKIGIERQENNARRFRVANEALGGIKDIKIYGKEEVFQTRFSTVSKMFAQSCSTHITIAHLPKYALEIIAFSGIILITLYLLGSKQRFEHVFYVLGLYAIATYRLLPAIQQIFGGITSIRFYMKSMDSLCQGIEAHEGERTKIMPPDEGCIIPMREDLKLQELTFYYPGTNRPIIKDMNMIIKSNTSIAFVGLTGSGKTTLIDIIVGLLLPQEGRMLVDNIRITNDNIPAWRKNCGYVPQHIYLLDDTITKNIAFGISGRDIDLDATVNAARVAGLHDFIMNNLPDQYDTTIGERGVRLSGGERQRLGIARALYHNPDLIIFDEATSALDGMTEAGIMREIHGLSHKKTLILVAHRLSTVKECDVIYLLNRGRIVATGSYDELITTNRMFQEMARRTGK